MKYGMSVVAGLAVAAGTSWAQPSAVNLLTNPSFEQATVIAPLPSTKPPRDADTGANGWYRFNNGSQAVTDFARTGTKSMKVQFLKTGDFEGAWNGARFNDDPNPDLRRPFASVVPFAAGPLSVGGYYLLPTAFPITSPGWTSPKVEVFSDRPFDPIDPGDPLFYVGFEFANQITGTTNNQWQQFSFTVQPGDWPAGVARPRTGADIQMRFLVIMFRPGGTVPPVQDRAYWDDLSLSQGYTLPCYANCDGSTTVPALNALDFGCFLQRYQRATRWQPENQAGAYANCDGSTTVPALNALDFSCFLTQYRAATGCQ